MAKIYKNYENLIQDYIFDKKYKTVEISGDLETVVIDDESFYKSDKIIALDNFNIDSNLENFDPKKPFKCNFSFNVRFDLKLSLPNINSPAPNFDLLKKIKIFTNEVAKIDKILIRAIQDMGCCDIENTYNKTVVPVLRWFADHKDIKYCSYEKDAEQNCGPFISGNTFPMILYNIAEILIEVYLNVRPFVCLLRPLPGNPWYPWDIDFLAPIRYIISYFDIFYDEIISGKIMNPMITKTQEFRKNIQNCLGYGYNNINDTMLDMLKTDYKTSVLKKYLAQKEMKSVFIENKIKKIKAFIDNLYNAKIAIKINYVTNERINSDYTEITILSLILKLKTYYNINYENNLLAFKELNSKLDSSVYQIFNETFIKNNFPNYYSDFLKGIVKNNTVTIIFEDSNFDMLNFENTLPASVALENIAQTIYNGISSFISEVINLLIINYEQLQFYNNQLDVLKAEIKYLRNQIKNIISTNKSEENKIIVPELYKKVSFENMLSNSDNICECVWISLSYLSGFDGKIPIIKYFKYINTKEFSNNGILHKKDTKIIINDFGSFKSEAAKLSFGKVDPKYFNEKLIYSDAFVDNLNSLYQEFIKNLSVSFDREYTEADIINNFKYTNYDLFKAFLNALDSKYSTEIFSYFEVELKEYSFKNPYGDNEYQIKASKFKPSLLPKSFKISEYYSFLNFERVFKFDLNIELKNLEYMLKKSIFDIDRENWEQAKIEIQRQIILINDYINNYKKYGLSYNDKVRLIDYLDFLDYIFNNFFVNYPEIDLINDPDELKVKNFENLGYSNDTAKKIVSKLANEIIDEYINKRKKLINNNFELLAKYQVYNEMLNDLEKFQNNYPLNDISITVYDYPDVRCNCDIFCYLIQLLINLLLSLLSSTTQYLFNLIMEMFWKTPLGQLIKFIILKLRCASELIKLKDDLDELHDLTDALIEGLKNNIKLYTDPPICMQNIINNLENQTNVNNTDLPILPPTTDLNQIIANKIKELNDKNQLSEELSQASSNPIIDNYEIITQDQTFQINAPNLIPETFNAAFQNLTGVTLPAQLILSENVSIEGINNYGNYTFPTLIFNCNCDENNCNDCLIKENKIDTLKFLNS